MKELDERIAAWMKANPGMFYVVSYTGIGLFAWRCAVTLASGTELARGTGETDHSARRNAFTSLFAIMPNKTTGAPSAR